MTEALIADLARVGGLRVISRTSTMAYKAPKEPLTLPQIAQQLNVDATRDFRRSCARWDSTLRRPNPLWSRSDGRRRLRVQRRLLQMESGGVLIRFGQRQ